MVVGQAPKTMIEKIKEIKKSHDKENQKGNDAIIGDLKNKKLLK